LAPLSIPRRYAGEGASISIKAVEPTAYSLRSAVASGSGSPPALHGAIPVKEAMDRVAAAWERITDDLRRHQQRTIYRASMGLPPTPWAPRPQPLAEAARVRLGLSQATTTEPWRLLLNKALRVEADKHPHVQLLVRDGMDQVERQVAELSYTSSL